MNTAHLKRVRQLFDHDPLVPRKVRRHNMRQWCISIRFLGARWVLAAPQKRSSL